MNHDIDIYNNRRLDLNVNDIPWIGKDIFNSMLWYMMCSREYF